MKDNLSIWREKHALHRFSSISLHHFGIYSGPHRPMPRAGYSAWAAVTMAWFIREYVERPVGDRALKFTSSRYYTHFWKGQIPFWLPRFVVEQMDVKTRAHWISAPSSGIIHYHGWNKAWLWVVETPTREGCGLILVKKTWLKSAPMPPSRTVWASRSTRVPVVTGWLRLFLESGYLRLVTCRRF